jgi:hypothetical protein
MQSVCRTTIALISAALVLAVLALGACVLAAIDYAKFRVLEEQGRHLAPTAVGVEVMQRAETKAHAVHASHAARHDTVIA